MQNRYRHLTLVAIISLPALVGVPEHASAVTFAEFSIPTANSSPNAGRCALVHRSYRQQDWAHLDFRSDYRKLRSLRSMAAPLTSRRGRMVGFGLLNLPPTRSGAS